MKTALISISNKKHIFKFAEYLLKNNYNILSTGGTYKFLKSRYDNITHISSFIDFPEILGGRVKTLHPKIYGGILADRNNPEHLDELNKFNGKLIDMVVVNLYPFQEIVTKDHTFDQAIENIDIGGVSLIRSAAKNFKYTKVIIDPSDYQGVIDDKLNNKELAVKAFKYVTNYDARISEYLGMDVRFREYNVSHSLKYGSNPHQKESFVYNSPFEVLNGNPGYNNYLDAMTGWQLVNEVHNTLGGVTAASMKHTIPTGVGSSYSLTDIQKEIYDVGDISSVATAFTRARNTDPMSSFGDFIAISAMVDLETAKLIKREISDGIVAPSYQPEALELLKTKKKGNYVILKGHKCNYHEEEFKEIGGLALSQPKIGEIKIDFHNVSSNVQFNLMLANITLKYTPSNSIVYTYNGQTIGIGAGQQNRVDCVILAGERAKMWWLRHDYVFNFEGTRQEKINKTIKYIQDNKLDHDMKDICMASDGFFPFVDSIEESQKYGVRYITHPGGSIADEKIHSYCRENGITIIPTNFRLFCH